MSIGAFTYGGGSQGKELNLSPSDAAFPVALEARLYTLLAAITNLQTILANDQNSSDYRIYPEAAPKDSKFPFVVYNVISDKDEGRHMGAGSLCKHAEIQIDVYTLTSVLRGQIAWYIYNCLHGLFASAGGSTDNVKWIQSITCLETANMYEDPQNDSDKGKYRKRMHFSVWYFDSVLPSLTL